MAKSFWDEFKDLFKTDAEKEEEKRQQINDALEREKEISNQLSALDKEYKDSLPKEEEIDFEKLFPSDSGLKELEYQLDTDDDIAKRAEKENSYSKNKELSGLESKYDKQSSALSESRKKAEQTLGEGYKQLQELYDQLRKRTENDTLKRGLARSSIAATQLGDLDSARLEGMGNLRASYNSSINDIEESIAKLEADRDHALEELDLKYAVELDDRISELKAERDKTAKTYEEYNAKVRKQNNEYAQKREENISKYIKDKEEEKRKAEDAQIKHENKYGYTGAKQENYSKRYDIAYDFYSSLSPDIAADALEASPNMKYYLGAYYNKLLDSLKNKQEGETRVF